MRKLNTILLLVLLGNGIAKTAAFGEEIQPKTKAAIIVDPADIQHFEQTYEEWVQSLVQSIAPTIPATVLVELEYSNAAEKLQTYEEIRASNHLPGLPEVVDPNFTYPAESPLYALVNHQHVKIIFEHEVSANQRKVLTEVLNTKLKINSARGDQLVFEYINEGLAVKNGVTTNRKQAAAFIFLSLMGILLVSLKRTQRSKLIDGIAANAERLSLRTKNTSHEAMLSLAPIFKIFSSIRAQRTANTHSSIKTVAVPPSISAKISKLIYNQEKLTAENKLIQKINQNHPRISSQTSKIVNPVQLILKSNPRQLIKTVHAETPLNIATAMVHAPAEFSSIMMEICTKEQAIAVRNILRMQKDKISEEKTKQAQFLLAAKINFDANPPSVSQINGASL